MISKEALCIIPARGGSKGIPHKNNNNFFNKPLFAHTYEAALNSRIFDCIIVSTDCPLTIKYCKENSFEFIERPEQLAKDDSPMFPVIEHTIDTVRQIKNMEFQKIVLLQPTSPLRNSTHIKEAFELSLEKGIDTVISVCKPSLSPYKMFKINDAGQIEPLFDLDSAFKQRQELPEVFQPNGAIYIYKVEQLLKQKNLNTNNCKPYIMPSEYSIDIDTPEDLELAEYYWQKHVGEKQ